MCTSEFNLTTFSYLKSVYSNQYIHIDKNYYFRLDIINNPELDNSTDILNFYRKINGLTSKNELTIGYTMEKIKVPVGKKTYNINLPMEVLYVTDKFNTYTCKPSIKNYVKQEEIGNLYIYTIYIDFSDFVNEINRLFVNNN
ncbi:hypothetical protein H012_gp127 [Acanthamoeba polyphaga moumouvirus]|uniref:Uncharacterized protein n=1 Tax=Acanthamoeba polyphaga moumouvirus TaxID=1269028 RepID=L7RDY6_9VIRU|nr:hypothetical protein H012_gp127 [Acanthamoeba polyphaga moumouvirus]AGC02323.1 hypothetical protein Moumou_00805 [Acanthamoeba polyphaga moumouvirus]